MCLISRNEWSPNGGNAIALETLLSIGPLDGEAYERFGCSATDSVHQQAVRGGCMKRSLVDPTNRSLAAFCKL